MSDIGFTTTQVVLMLLAVFAPGPAGGAVIGAVVWRVAFKRRWWIGALIGIPAGAAIWFPLIRYW